MYLYHACKHILLSISMDASLPTDNRQAPKFFQTLLMARTFAPSTMERQKLNTKRKPFVLEQQEQGVAVNHVSAIIRVWC